MDLPRLSAVASTMIRNNSETSVEGWAPGGFQLGLTTASGLLILSLVFLTAKSNLLPMPH